MLDSAWLGLLICLLTLPQPFAMAQDLQVEVLSQESQEPSSASWIRLSSEQLVVQAGNNEQALAISGLKSVRFPNHPMRQSGGSPPSAAGSAESPKPASEAAGPGDVKTGIGPRSIVQLQDGSRIQPQLVQGDGQSVNMELDAGFTVPVRASHIHSIQLQALTPAQQTQWEAVLDSRISADTLVLVRSAESIDKIEGVIGGISSDFVQFEFSGQKLNAPRNKLAGLRYFSPSGPASEIACVVTDVLGNSWNAAQVVSLTDQRELELTLACGEKVGLPLELVHLLDFSQGSQAYVAELPVLGQGRKAAIELGIPLPGSDQLFGAQPVMLPKTNGPSLKFLGSGWASYRIPPKYTRLSGIVYLSPSGNHFTPCKVQVQLENEVIWEQQLTDLSQRLELSVPIEPDKRLRFEVEPQGSFPVGDVVIWQELRLLK